MKPAIALVAALVALASIPGFATQQAAQDPQNPIFREGIDLIRLDVSVLDKKRRPVRGLTAEDFTVFENGKAQRVVAVAEIAAAEQDVSPSAWMKHIPRDVVANDLNEQAGDGRFYAIIMDDVNVPWDDLDIIRQARETARYLIDRLGPSDVAAVVFPRDGGKSQDFTEDRLKLLEAVDRFDPREPERFLPGGNTSYRPGPGGGDMPQRFSPVLGHTNCDLRQLAVPAFETTVARLATVPNRRKTVIFVSTGMSISFGPGDRCDFGLRMRDVFRRAQRSTVNIYSIDPAGYRGYERYLSNPIRRGGRPAEFVATEATAERMARSRRDFLEIMAQETGASAIVNTDDVESGIERIFVEDSSYYLVGYQTSNGKPDGKFRRIEVKVNRPDVTVRTRSGYYAPTADSLETREAREAPKTSDLGLVGLMNTTGLPMRATTMPLARTGTGRDVEVGVVLSVRLPALRSAATEKVTITRNLYDERGDPGPPMLETLSIPVTPAGGDEVRYDVLYRMTLAPGRYELRLHARSEVVNDFGTVFVPIEVPDLSRGALTMTTIALGTAPAPGSVRTDALADLLPIVPTSAREFSPNDRPTAFVRLYSPAGPPVGDVTIDAQVLDAADRTRFQTSKTIPVSAFDSSGAAPVQIELPLDGFEHGPYVLSIRATRPDGVNGRRDVVFKIR